MVQSNLWVKSWFTNIYKNRKNHIITAIETDKLTSIRVKAIAGGRGIAVDYILLKGRLEE